MFPAAFDYRAPATLDEALAILADADDDGKVVSGGQSLIPLLRLRFAAPSVVVDINRIPGLAGIEETEQGLRLGALTRHAEILDSPLLARRWPILVSAAGQIADPQVRNLGTIGGALAHADPEGDWGAVMLALRAELSIAGRDGVRRTPMRGFVEAMFTTTMGPAEILTAIDVPRRPGRHGGVYLKLFRRVGDFAAAGVAVQLRLEERGRVRRQTRIAEAGVALTALGPVNAVAEEAEEVLRGEPPSPELFERAAGAAASAVDSHDDARGSVEYKRAVVREFVRRGLRHAAETAC